MAFAKKTWTDRVAEYISRRLLTYSNGSTELVTVTREEGTVSTEGDAFSAENMNDLEQRISDEFTAINDSLEHCYRLDVPTRIPNGADVHTLTDFKNYYCGNAEHASTLINAPVTNSGFSYRFEKINGSTDGTYGIATAITTSGIEYKAHCTNGTWSEWIKTPTIYNLDGEKVLISSANGYVTTSDVTSTELGYLGGVTSKVQTQLNGKQATITGGATSILSSDLTASRVLVSNSNGKVGVSAVTSTELSYLGGVTSNVQTQLDEKMIQSSGGGEIEGGGTYGIAYNGKLIGLSNPGNYIVIIFTQTGTNGATGVGTIAHVHVTSSADDRYIQYILKGDSDYCPTFYWTKAGNLCLKSTQSYSYTHKYLVFKV